MNSPIVMGVEDSMKGGLQIKSYWDGDDTVCHFTAAERNSGGFPGFLYCGIITSLLDCHGAATASSAKGRADGKPLGRFVTASVKVQIPEH